MRATIWGCRGSTPAPGPDTVRYGGNTSCVELLLSDGSVLVLDAGTGIRGLGRELERRGTRLIHLLLTHLHLDHLEGLRFFDPLWDPEVELHVWGPPSTRLPLRERIARVFSPPVFPIDLIDVPARLEFHDTPRQRWTIGAASLSAEFVLHPGPTVGYRVDADSGTLAYIPDHEPALAGPVTERSLDWISGASLATGADVLLHDAQYSESEYAEHVGWGHSSLADAVAFGEAVAARRLVLFHHDPSHDDAALEGLEERARASASSEPTLAREAMVLDVG